MRTFATDGRISIIMIAMVKLVYISVTLCQSLDLSVRR
jgi:hypothetical protein